MQRFVGLENIGEGSWTAAVIVACNTQRRHRRDGGTARGNGGRRRRTRRRILVRALCENRRKRPSGQKAGQNDSKQRSGTFRSCPPGFYPENGPLQGPPQRLHSDLYPRDSVPL